MTGPLKHSAPATVSSALTARRSYSRVTPDAPTHEELVPLVAAAGRVADHSALQPWRIIELRGDARTRLGEAFVEASGDTGSSAAKPVKRMHGLAKNERLLGWLYVGGVPSESRSGPRKLVDAERLLSTQD